MAQTTRRRNRYPLGSDGPADVPTWMNRLATDLDDAPRDGQGVLGDRPPQTPLAPGDAGQWFTTTDETGGRRIYRGHGTGYDEVATAPVADRAIASMDAAKLTGSLAADRIPAGLVTVAMLSAALLARFNVHTVLNDAVGPLNVSGSYTPAGGRCWAYFKGSGYRGIGEGVGVGALVLAHDGVEVGRARQRYDELDRQGAVGGRWVSLGRPTAVAHTLRLSPSGLVTTAESFFDCVVVELP